MEKGLYAANTGLPNDETNIRCLRIVLRSQHGSEAERLDNQAEFPRAAKATLDSFYVDDGLLGAVPSKMQYSFARIAASIFARRFRVGNGKLAERAVEQSIETLRDEESSYTIKYAERFTKVLGVEWNSNTDTFRPQVSTTCPAGKLTKRLLMSGIARLFDILGWCSPAIIIPKMLLNVVGELGWDELVPQPSTTHGINGPRIW